MIAGSLQALNRIIDDENRKHLEALVRDRVSPAVAELGWEPRSGESELTKQLRGDLLRALGVLGNDPATQTRAAELFARQEARTSSVDANVWAAVIAIVAHSGDGARYNDFLVRFKSAKTPQDEQRYLYALAACRPTEMVERTLTATLNGEFRTQDAPFVVRSLLWSVHGRQAAWRFVRDNWDEMKRQYPVTGQRRMFEGVIGLARAEWEAEVIEFFNERAIDLGGKTLRQYLEQLRIAVALREREGDSLRG